MQQRGAIRIITAVLISQLLVIVGLLALVNYNSNTSNNIVSTEERRHTLANVEFDESQNNSLFTVVTLAFGIIALILVTIQCAKKEKPVKDAPTQQSSGPSVTIAQPASQQQHVINPVPIAAVKVAPPLPPPRKSFDGNTPRAIRSDSIADMPDLIDQTMKNKPALNASEMEITVRKPDVATEDIKQQAQHDRQGQLSKVCVAWVNKHINCISEEISNITTDLRNGVMMIRLVQILANLRMPQYHAKPFNDIQRIANLNQLIKFLYTVGIEINGIEGKDLLNAPENVWTTIILILMQTYKDVKPRPRPPPRTRAPTVDVSSIPTPSSRARATSRPPGSGTLSNSSSARLITDPGIESPRGAESNNGANAKRPPPVPRTSKPALTFKKSPAVNSDGNLVDSPKKPESPPSSNNSNVSAEPVTPKSPVNNANKTDMAAYDDDKEVNIDDIDLGEFGGDDFDADNYFKKLANDLGLKEIDSSYERVRMSILDFSKKSGGGIGMDRMSMLFANPRMSVLDFKDKDFDNLEQMLLQVAGDLNVDIDL
eukprot:TRINITY_DN2707_c0_g1_i1.p1 TRINITY_DN2707_c0_g1~~TRINITY_DN2707_c0_g1_i1.p1  ORF type:complete len:542 (+),score=110.56 TRINITY_DN2707_c0_g1_i1:148-1773(+)